MSLLLKTLPFFALPFFALAAPSDLSSDLGGYSTSGFPAKAPPFNFPTERFAAVYSNPNATASASFRNLGFNNVSETWSINLALAANVSLEGATGAGNVSDDNVTQLTVLSLERAGRASLNTESVRVSIQWGLSSNATGSEDDISSCNFVSDECRRALTDIATGDNSGPDWGTACRDWSAGAGGSTSFDLGSEHLNEAEPFFANGASPREKDSEEANEMYEYALTKIWAVVLVATEAGLDNDSTSQSSVLRCVRAGTIEDESDESDGNNDGEDGSDDAEDDDSAAGMIKASASAAIIAFAAAMVMA